jgi:hypothetical protein
LVDGAAETVRLDMLLVCASAGSNGGSGILGAQTRLCGTETAQTIRIGLGPGECDCQRGGLTRDSLRRFDEFVEVAFVGARPFHHPSGAIADVCEMFES